MRSNPSIGQWVVTYFTCYSTPWGAQLQRGDPVGPPVGRRESPTWRSEATARSIEGGGTTLTATDVRELGERYSNWGRWGADDERGTANFITEQVVLAACAIPRVAAWFRVLSTSTSMDQCPTTNQPFLEPATTCSTA